MGIALITVVTVAVVGALAVVFMRARRTLADPGEVVTRADTQRYLAEHWSLVEASARESGMSDDEIARVRANVLGLS